MRSVPLGVAASVRKFPSCISILRSAIHTKTAISFHSEEVFLSSSNIPRQIADAEGFSVVWQEHFGSNDRATYQITSRGNRRQRIFDRDREHFLGLFAEP